MEENKVVEFPNNNVAEQELSPQEQEVFAKLEPLLKEQDEIISEMVNATCRSFDAQAAQAKTLPIFVPMEAGFAISATYLNMISDEQGNPIESITDDIQNLAMVISKAVNGYYEENPEVPANVYYYALIHAATSSLRHQRLLNNVNALKEQQEGEE